MKVKVAQIQTQIAAAEAERKRIIETLEREVTQRCISRLPFVSHPKILLTIIPSGPSECHRFNRRRYASSDGEPAVQVGKEMQRARKRIA